MRLNGGGNGCDSVEFNDFGIAVDSAYQHHNRFAHQGVVLPLVCPWCGGNMRILAFITEGVQIRRILEHIGVDALAPPIAPARGPPLWDECDAQGADGAGQEAPIDPTGASQPRQHPMTRPINAPIGEWTDRPATRTRRGAGRAGRAPGRPKWPGKRSIRTR